MTRVLLIEDNPADVALLQEELRDVATAQSLTFIPTTTLAEGLEVLDNGDGDVALVLADLGLPDSDGRATITRLLEAHPHLPVVALTGHDDDVAALAAVDAGAQDYIVKGTVPGSVLARLIRHAIERHRLQAVQQRGLRFRDELLDFSQLALRDASPAELHEELARLLMAALPAAQAGVFTVPAHGGPPVPLIWHDRGGPVPPVGAVADEAVRAVRAVAATGRSISYDDILDEGPCQDEGRSAVRSLVAAPVDHEDPIELVILAGADLPQAFDDDDRSFVTGLAYALTQALRRRAAESSLNARMHELKLTVEQMPGILWTLDGDLRVMSCAGAALEELGVAADDLLGARLVELPREVGVRGVVEPARSALHGDPVTVEGAWHGRWWRTRCEPLRDQSGAVIGVTGLSLDVTEEHSRQAELAHRALHDTVTHLANRTLFHDRLDHALELARRNGGLVGVAVLDLDEFKQINDSLGHAAGDAVLIEVAHRLEHTIRNADTAARLGGDEFAILLEGLGSIEDGHEAVERVLDALRRPFHVGGRELAVTASLGLATSRGEQVASTLLRDADTAVYSAKAAGRNRHVVFEPDMHLAATRQLELRTELAAAVEHGALALHVQPALELGSGEITGGEALCRWTHPTLGEVPPTEFIPLAEQTGLMIPLGWWVLHRACQLLADWQERWPGFLLSVNISDRQLQDEGFVAGLDELLERFSIRPGSLCLEFGEDSVVDTERVRPVIEHLRALGVRVAVDDFGTGYSSFTSLRRLGVDVIKVDRRFIADIDQGPEAAAITRAILQLADSLEIGVIAEGVETEQQAELLRAWRCGAAQGWLWAAAMPPEGFEAWAERSRGRLQEVSS